jgi:hypothetical protein
MGKTNIIKFCSNHFQINLNQSASANNIIKEVTNTNFLGLGLDNNMNWKNHVAKILPKLSRSSYAVRAMYPFSSLNTLKMIYFAYFHLRIHYGIIFGGNSTESKKVFLAQKKVIRIMTGSRPRTSCKPLFQSLGILTLPSQYILSLMEFLLQNQEVFTSNIEVHNINTRNKLKLHKPISNLTLYQKGVYCMCIRIFNKLPKYIVKLVGSKRIFTSTLRQYLVSKPLYSIEEFLNDYYSHMRPGLGWLPTNKDFNINITHYSIYYIFYTLCACCLLLVNCLLSCLVLFILLCSRMIDL